MATARFLPTATLLSSGKVLVSGGQNRIGGGLNVMASAELYDPASNSWSATGSMAAARTGHTATTLSSGQVLVLGGGNAEGTLASTEIYTP